MQQIEENDHRYVYIIVRTDIPVSHQMAQACHGALEAGLKFPNDRGSTNSIIVLKVKDNGLTQFHGVKTLTAIAIGPDDKSIINEITGHLKLL